MSINFVCNCLLVDCIMYRALPKEEKSDYAMHTNQKEIKLKTKISPVEY